MLLCFELKKQKHFALTGFKWNKKKRINSKNIYNVPELTDPLTFVIKSYLSSFSVFLMALFVLIVSL